MEKVIQFLERVWDQKSPLLLGYSGGPDSKALLYVLLEWGRAPLHLAHVDHGWRESSRNEAELLRREAEMLNLPFHTTRLKMEGGKNLEEKGRDERLKFFEMIWKQHPFQALLLAHQRDDLAETTFKRVLEGSHLPFLGMREESLRGEMRIWRPLLKVSKKEIETFLQKKGLEAIDDETNRNPLYLRARMRETVFPFLTQSFGKNFTENLSILGERGEELREYLEKKISSHPILRAPWGICFNLSSLEKIEARYLVQKYVSLTRELLEKVISGKQANWKINQRIYVDRNWVFILNENNDEFNILDLSEIQRFKNR